MIVKEKHISGNNINNNVSSILKTVTDNGYEITEKEINNFCILGNIIINNFMCLIEEFLEEVSYEDLETRCNSVGIGCREMNVDEALNDAMYDVGLSDSFLSLRDSCDRALSRFNMFVNLDMCNSYHKLNHIPKIKGNSLYDKFSNLAIDVDISLSCVNKYNNNTNEYTEEYIVTLGILVLFLKSLINDLENNFYIPF